MSGMSELYAYTLLVLVGFLPTDIWRAAGLVAVRGVNEESEIFLWARAVATAVLAAVVAKIVLFPPGALASVPHAVRLGAIACGLAAFFAARRSVFAGVAAGEAALIAGAYAYRV
jgi:hypothetical protein